MSDLRELAEAANRPAPPSMHHGFINDDYLVWEAARRAFEEAATPFAVLALLDAAEARAPLDVERLYDALAHWYDGADGGESFRLVPMSSDGGVMPTGDLHPFAAAIAREYAALEEPTDD